MQNTTDMHAVLMRLKIATHTLTYQNLKLYSVLYCFRQGYMAKEALKKLINLPAVTVSLKYYQQHRNNAVNNT